MTEPAWPRALCFGDAASPRAILGRAHTDHLPQHVAMRIIETARTYLSWQTTQIEMEVEAASANSGGSIVLWTRDGGSVLGAGHVVERSVRAEVFVPVQFDLAPECEPNGRRVRVRVWPQR